MIPPSRTPVRGMTTPASLRAVLAAPIALCAALAGSPARMAQRPTAFFRDQACTHLRKIWLCPWVRPLNESASDALGSTTSARPGIHPPSCLASSQRPQNRLIEPQAGLTPIKVIALLRPRQRAREVNSTVCVLHRFASNACCFKRIRACNQAPVCWRCCLACQVGLVGPLPPPCK